MQDYKIIFNFMIRFQNFLKKMIFNKPQNMAV